MMSSFPDLSLRQMNEINSIVEVERHRGDIFKEKPLSKKICRIALSILAVLFTAGVGSGIAYLVGAALPIVGIVAISIVALGILVSIGLAINTYYKNNPLFHGFETKQGAQLIVCRNAIFDKKGELLAALTDPNKKRALPEELECHHNLTRIDDLAQLFSEDPEINKVSPLIHTGGFLAMCGTTREPSAGEPMWLSKYLLDHSRIFPELLKDDAPSEKEFYKIQPAEMGNQQMMCNLITDDTGKVTALEMVKTLEVTPDSGIKSNRFRDRGFRILFNAKIVYDFAKNEIIYHTSPLRKIGLSGEKMHLYGSILDSE